MGVDRTRVQMIISRLADAGFVKHLGIGSATLTPAGREQVERTTLSEQQLNVIEDQRHLVPKM